MAADPVGRPFQLQIRHIDFAAQISHLGHIKDNNNLLHQTIVTLKNKCVGIAHCHQDLELNA
jgi:hypothetical protein